MLPHRWSTFSGTLVNNKGYKPHSVYSKYNGALAIDSGQEDLYVMQLRVLFLT